MQILQNKKFMARNPEISGEKKEHDCNISNILFV